MKLLFATISIACGSAFADGQQTITDIRFGISPFLDDTAKAHVRQAVTQFILQAPPGSSVNCDDAYNLQTVATFAVPRLRFDSAANRARTLAQPLASLARWFAATNGMGQTEELRGTAALKMPEWLRQVSAEFADRSCALVLVGSPLYVSTTEPAFSMTPDLYPGDGHLTASLEQSVYGLGEETNRLKGVTVHWLYPGESVFANALHEYHVRRFWTLYISLHGGVLADFTGDAASVLGRAAKPGLAPVGRFAIQREDAKLTMRAARPREIPKWMPLGAGGTNAPAQARPAPSPQPSGTSVSGSRTVILPWRGEGGSGTGIVGGSGNPAFAVGLMWEAKADIDLYLTPPGGPELWFGNVRGPTGRYLHDFRDRNASQDYEWVELWQPVDPSQTEVWVNYYSGSGPVTGTVCVYYQGKTHLAPFTLQATQGNRGGDHAFRSTSPYWTKIDLQKILQQSPQQ